ncbi:MAG: prepilin peptidase [Pseudomonadota bacterium]
MTVQLLTLVFIGFCLFAALRDLATLTIPNWLNLSLALSFIGACLLVQPGWETVGWHLVAGAIAFAISVALFASGVFGGGDAKMIPGIMLWIGPGGAMSFVYAMALAGGLLAVLVILARKWVPAHAAPGFAYETLQDEKGVPYGIAIAAGAFAAMPPSPFLTSFLS